MLKKKGKKGKNRFFNQNNLISVIKVVNKIVFEEIL